MYTRLTAALGTIALGAASLLIAAPAPDALARETAARPADTAAPSIAGKHVAGQMLTCSAGTWTGNPDSYEYDWMRDGGQIATGSQYTIQRADWGHSLACRVSARNSGGEYVLGGLQSGAYRVSFQDDADDLLSQYFSGQSSMWMATPVAVNAPNLTGSVDASLHAAGQIAGTVTAAADGKSLAHVQVCAQSSGPEGSGHCAWTNDTGRYAIAALPSGQYTVEFDRIIPVRESSEYLPLYYDARTTRDEADLVSVTAGSTTSGIDAALRLGGGLSGQVTAAAGGASIGGVKVCAAEPAEGAPPKPELPHCAVTGADGDYEIVGLTSGSYRVEFLPSEGNYVSQYYDDQANSGSAELVAVVSGAITPGIDAALHDGGQISGRVTAADGGQPLSAIKVCADASDGRCASTDAAGDYTIVGVPTGLHAVEFKPEGENYLEQFYPGKPTWFEAERVSVSADSTTAGIDAALAAGGQIVGTVTAAATGAPLGGVAICPGAYSGPCTHSDTSGHYALVGLPSGEYSPEFTLYEGNYLPEKPGAVTVAAGNVAKVDASMRPAGQIAGRVTSASTGEGLAGVSVCASPIGPVSSFACGQTNAGGEAASATSPAVAIPKPNSAFTFARRPRLNRRTGELDFYLRVGNPGRVAWGLFQAHGMKGRANAHRSVCPLVAAKSSTRKPRCRRAPGPFSRGSRVVGAAGVVEVKTRLGAFRLRSLRHDHTIRVEAAFVFASAFGGAASSRRETVTLRPARRRRHAA